MRKDLLSKLTDPAKRLALSEIKYAKQAAEHANCKHWRTTYRKVTTLNENDEFVDSFERTVYDSWEDAEVRDHHCDLVIIPRALSSNECKHGNVVGSAPGGENICGRCEDGDLSVYEAALNEAYAFQSSMVDYVNGEVRKAVFGTLKELGTDPSKPLEWMPPDTLTQLIENMLVISVMHEGNNAD